VHATATQRLAALTGTAFHDGICYSGYREGQSPRTGVYPTYEQIKQDLGIVRRNWKVIRIYDCSPHGLTTLEVVRREFPDMRVLIGVDLDREFNNPGCPWGSPISEAELEANRRRNESNIRRAAEVSRAYADVVLAVSAGNECTVDWTERSVPVERAASFLHQLKADQPRPVTLCENNVPWLGKIKDLVPLVDFISIHSYPAWLNVPVEQAVAHTEQEYEAIASLYPDKPAILTEAGWTTTSNGRGILRENASAQYQSSYCPALAAWSRRRGIPVFLFEAFDEPWKGSDDLDEPEKHWGMYFVNRAPKPVMHRYPARA
jgi:exo-beta-1,3-glucanase (GH17 family)